MDDHQSDKSSSSSSLPHTPSRKRKAAATFDDSP